VGNRFIVAHHEQEWILDCVAVPVTIPFAGTQRLNYSVEMQQRTGAFVFDLDLNTVKQQ